MRALLNMPLYKLPGEEEPEPRPAMKVYGKVGIVTYDPIEDKLRCHLCGRWRRSLGVHVVVAHGWTADDYREEFGLNRDQSLVCEGIKEKLRRINRELGQYKHLNSQTMTKPELLEFLKGIQRSGHKLREQSLIRRSERLKEYNPMNEAEAQERSRAKLRQTWYGSERMRSICRSNLIATIAKIRESNLKERRWSCPCGQTFPIRDEAYHHRRHCAIARQSTIEKQSKAKKNWWERASPETREQQRRRESESKKRLFRNGLLSIARLRAPVPAPGIEIKPAG